MSFPTSYFSKRREWREDSLVKRPPAALLHSLRTSRDISSLAIIYRLRLSCLQKIAKTYNIRLKV